MNIENPQTCEECLGLLTGIEVPKPGRPKIQDYGYKLQKTDATILISIAKQVSKGIAFTDRQYALVKKKLAEYEDQFDDKGIDVVTVSNNLMFELREIDRAHWIKVLRWKDDDILGIRFPFNKKVINHVESLRKLNKIQDLAYKDNTHYFPYTSQNVFALVNIANRFESKFTIQKDILDVYYQLLDYENNKEDYIPGIYNNIVKNIPSEAIDILEKQLGAPANNNLFLYYDRRYLYGLKHFDFTVEQMTDGLTTLSSYLVKRQSSTINIPSNKFSFDELVSSIHTLQRFPLLIVLDEKTAHDSLVTTYNSFRNVVDAKDISVMFRKDGNDPFNNYVKDNFLNNSVASNTKIVYINNTKLPKPLLQAKWLPSCVLNFGGKSLSFNTVTQFIQQFDLQIIYEDAKTSLGYWNRLERKYTSGNL